MLWRHLVPEVMQQVMQEKAGIYQQLISYEFYVGHMRCFNKCWSIVRHHVVTPAELYFANMITDLTLWGRDKIEAILTPTFLDLFSCTKNVVLWFENSLENILLVQFITSHRRSVRNGSYYSLTVNRWQVFAWTKMNNFYGAIRHHSPHHSPLIEAETKGRPFADDILNWYSWTLTQMMYSTQLSNDAIQLKNNEKVKAIAKFLVTSLFPTQTAVFKLDFKPGRNEMNICHGFQL